MTSMLLAANSVSIYKGSSKTLCLTVNNGTGCDSGTGPVNLTGATIYFTVKCREGDPSPIISKSSNVVGQIVITEPRAGKAKIYLTPLDTNLDPGQYKFDVWVVLSSGKRYPVVTPSIIEILPAVTEIPI